MGREHVHGACETVGHPVVQNSRADVNADARTLRCFAVARYAATSKMIVEGALCLADPACHDIAGNNNQGGVLTPATGRWRAPVQRGRRRVRPLRCCRCCRRRCCSRCAANPFLRRASSLNRIGARRSGGPGVVPLACHPN